MRITETYSIDEAFKDLHSSKKKVKESIKVENKKKNFKESMLDKLVDARNNLAGKKDEIREGEEICSNHGNKNAILEEDDVCPDCGKEVCESERLEKNVNSEYSNLDDKTYFLRTINDGWGHIEFRCKQLAAVANKLEHMLKSDMESFRIYEKSCGYIADLFLEIQNTKKSIDKNSISLKEKIMEEESQSKRNSDLKSQRINKSESPESPFSKLRAWRDSLNNLEEAVKEEPGEYKEALKFAKTIRNMDIDEAQALWDDFEFETHGPETPSEQVVYDALKDLLDK